MLGQTPRPFSSIALVATLLISGVGITAPPTTARADDCLTAPNSPAPQGSHWYFHLDRATQRKCWYVRAPGQPAQQATAATTGPATPMHSTPAPSGASSPDVSAPPSPHVKISAAKPIPAPVRSGTTAKTVQQSALDKNTASTPVVPAPQTSTSSETSPQAAAPPAVTWPDAAVALAAVKAQEPTAVPTDAPVAVATVKAQEPIAVPTDAGADSVSDDSQRIARRNDPTNNGGIPVIIFPVLALGLAGVGVLSGFAMKKAAERRARIIIDHPGPGPDSVDDQRQHEWRGDQYPHGSVVKGQELHSLVLAVSDPRPLRNDDGASQITQEIGEQFCRDYDRMLQSPADPHEEPLRGRTAAVSDPGPLRDDDGAFQITQEIGEQFCRDIERMLQTLSPHENPLRGRTAAVSDPGPLRDDDGAFQITQEISEQFCRDYDRMLQSIRLQQKPLRGRTAA